MFTKDYRQIIAACFPDLVIERCRPVAEGWDSVAVELDGVDYDVVLVESDSLAYDRFYNVIANPILWFIQHYLWPLRCRCPSPMSRSSGQAARPTQAYLSATT